MADNSTLPAAGDIIATDDIGGVKFQRVKLVYGDDGVNGGDVSLANPLPVNVASSGRSSVINFTRPANVTAYSAGDVVSGSTSDSQLDFTSAGTAGKSIVITEAWLRIDVATKPSGMTMFRLHLYSAAPTAIADNAVWDLSSTGDKSTYLGYIDLLSPVDVGSVLYEQTTNINKQVPLTTTTLFGLLVTNAAWTPASAQAISIGLSFMDL